MARTNNLTNFLNDVATAIKTKLGDSTAIPAAQFDSKIMDIETPGVYQDKQMEITVNGTYTVYPDVGYDALSSIRLTVDVSGTEPMEPTTATVDDVISPETFYSNGQKLTGTIIPTYDGNTFYPDKTMTNDFLVQSANFELGIGIRIDSGGLRFGKLVDNHWSTVKTFTTTELGTGTLAIYRAILFPYKDSDTTIKILITSSTSISGGFNIYGRIYELDFRNIDNPTITLLTTSGVLSSNSYERNNGRAGQIKLVWLTNSTCMLVQAYAPGVGYNSRSFYFRSLKINISDDNTMTVTNSRTRTLATDVYGDDWGGTPAGVATAYRSGNYVISVANKNYRGGNSGQWYYITIITDWVNNVDYQITNTSDIGYIVENGLVYGNNKICRVTSPTTTLYTTTINGLGSRFNYSVNGYAFMGTSSALQIYKLETERALLLDTYDSYGDTHLSEDGGVIYSWNPTNWTSLKTFILEQKLVSFIRKNIIYSDTSKSTATTNNVLNGKTFYNSSGLQIGAMPNNGTINITPSTSSQNIPAGYTSGGTVSAVTAAIDADITANNIKYGVDILGVTGTYTGIDTSDATAAPINIRNGETAYVNGQKITGILPVLTYPVNPEQPSDYNYQFIAATSTGKATRDGTDYLLGSYQIASQREPDSWMFEGNRKMKMGIPYSAIVTRGGITANKIKRGETIYGVTGTYDGPSDTIVYLDYLDINGCYFDTRVNVSGTKGMEITLAVNDSGHYVYFFHQGSAVSLFPWDVTTKELTCVLLNSSTNNEVFYNNTTYLNSIMNYTQNKRAYIKISGNSLYTINDDTTVANAFSTTLPSSQNTLIINPMASTVAFKFYGLRIFDVVNGQEQNTNYFLPCTFNGNLGIYDIVTKTFYKKNTGKIG